ncbi:hypothetical protein GQ54DRAFT_305543 [Martensiomyces pterosporus]|nr:hypothetical protein GQ54DRAFT_305543 [Martensiomyces pterosporus]
MAVQGLGPIEAAARFLSRMAPNVDSLTVATEFQLQPEELFSLDNALGSRFMQMKRLVAHPSVNVLYEGLPDFPPLTVLRLNSICANGSWQLPRMIANSLQKLNLGAADRLQFYSAFHESASSLPTVFSELRSLKVNFAALASSRQQHLDAYLRSGTPQFKFPKLRFAEVISDSCDISWFLSLLADTPIRVLGLWLNDSDFEQLELPQFRQMNMMAIQLLKIDDEKAMQHALGSIFKSTINSQSISVHTSLYYNAMGLDGLQRLVLAAYIPFEQVCAAIARLNRLVFFDCGVSSEPESPPDQWSVHDVQQMMLLQLSDGGQGLLSSRLKTLILRYAYKPRRVGEDQFNAQTVQVISMVAQIPSLARFQTWISPEYWKAALDKVLDGSEAVSARAGHLRNLEVRRPESGWPKFEL